jgi:hypothetical protein
VLKWENAVAIKERDALSRYAEKEQQLLGESKAEQQVAASLRLRELALRTGGRSRVKGVKVEMLSLGDFASFFLCGFVGGISLEALGMRLARDFGRSISFLECLLSTSRTILTRIR